MIRFVSNKHDCVTQLELDTGEKLSSPIFYCLSVRHRCHPTKSPLFPIYRGIQALCWTNTIYKGIKAAVVGVARGAEAVGNGAGLVNQGIAKCKANAEPLADACNRANYNIGAAPLVVVHPNWHADTKRVSNPRTDGTQTMGMCLSTGRCPSATPSHSGWQCKWEFLTIWLVKYAW